MSAGTHDDPGAFDFTAAQIARLFHVPEYMLTGVRRLARPRRRIPLRRVGRLL